MNIQNKFKKTNTIYKITKDMDLEGSTLIIPVGCTLDFQGGSFKNGTIEGNGTVIQSELRRIFDDNVVLEGVWNVKEGYPEWFGGKGDGITDNTQAIKNCIKYFTNTYISAGTYITNQIDDIPSFRTINGCGKKSIIQANPKMNLTNSYLLRTKNGGSGITFSNFVLLGGANSTESNYKIGGIYLRSTSNDVNDQWDTRNIIQNVEIKYCYAASIYVGTYQRENKISNCFITHTTNVGINCMGTDNMIIGCTVASSHHEGIVINGNNRVDSCKCFGCGASSTVTGKYALSLIGSKCNVSNVELQQNNYGGCIIQGNSNYVQITCDNNGSGTTNTVLGCHVVGSYNTVSVTSYNFSFHDNQYERYFVSTNWNTVGNNITVNGTPLQKNKMSALSPWSVDNICNNIMWNGYNITQSREVPFDKLVLPDLFRSNGTGSFYVNDSGLSFKLTSVTAVNVDALVQAISIYNSNAIDPDGCFSVKARFHKNGDIDTSVYPIIRVITRYKDSSGTTLTRVDQNTVVNLLDNKDSLDVYALTQYHYLSDKPASILSVSVEFAVRSTKLLSDVSINAYFDDIKIGATTSGNKVKFVNTNTDGTLASKVIIANKASDFVQENAIYKITTDINLNTALLELPANCTLDFQGGSFSNGTIVGKILNSSINIRHLGADINFSQALQNAINLGVSKIYIPYRKQVYIMDNGINMFSNITIEGIGGTPVIGRTDNVDDLVLFTLNNVNNVVFRNIYFTNGNPQIDTSHPGNGVIFIDKCKNIEISDCTINNVFGNTALKVSNTNGVTLKNDKFSNITYQCTSFRECTENILVDNCIYDTVTNLNSQHSYLFHTGVSNYTDKFDFRCRNVIIRNSTFKNNPLWEGIDSHGVHNILLENNTIENCKIGIMISSDDRANDEWCSKDIIIKDNTIIGINGDTPSSSAIFVGGTRNIGYATNIEIYNNCISNYIDSTGTAGYAVIRIAYCKDTNIYNNKIYNCLNHSIIYNTTSINLSVFNNNVTIYKENIDTKSLYFAYTVNNSANISITDNIVNAGKHITIYGVLAPFYINVYNRGNKFNCDKLIRTSSVSTVRKLSSLIGGRRGDYIYMENTDIPIYVVNNSHYRTSKQLNNFSLDISKLSFNGNIVTYNGIITNEILEDEELEITIDNTVYDAYVEFITPLTFRLRKVEDDSMISGSVINSVVFKQIELFNPFVLYGTEPYTGTDNFKFNGEYFISSADNLPYFFIDNAWYRADGVRAGHARSGLSSDIFLPSLASINGESYFCTDMMKSVYAYNNVWYDSSGYISIGNTNQRPINIYIGFKYYDKTIGKVISWNGTAWINLDGTALT